MRKMMLGGVLDSIAYSGRYLCIYATVLTLTFNFETLRPESVFKMYVLYAWLENVFCYFLQHGIKFTTEVVICSRRIQVKLLW